MEEKTIVKSNKGNLQNVIKKMYIGCLIPIAYLILAYIFNFKPARTLRYYYYHEFSLSDYLGSFQAFPFWMLSIFLVILTSVIYWWLKNTEITVTDKRVYGKTATGKRVDLPFDSVSAVATSLFKGITVATSSGKINFKMIANRDEIHKSISQLLIDRQNSKQEQKQVIVNNNDSTTEQLKQYKELLDNGIITQEEFDTKKKQLLDL